MPSAFFQGSLLLASITRAALGAEALARSEVLLSPLAIAGWCGLITNAFNLLPVGCLDGGRMMQVGCGRPVQGTGTRVCACAMPGPVLRTCTAHNQGAHVRQLRSSSATLHPATHKQYHT